jgi:hypothetical protein
MHPNAPQRPQTPPQNHILQTEPTAAHLGAFGGIPHRPRATRCNAMQPPATWRNRFRHLEKRTHRVSAAPSRARKFDLPAFAAG